MKRQNACGIKSSLTKNDFAITLNLFGTTQQATVQLVALSRCKITPHWQAKQDRSLNECLKNVLPSEATQSTSEALKDASYSRELALNVVSMIKPASSRREGDTQDFHLIHLRDWRHVNCELRQMKIIARHSMCCCKHVCVHA